MSIIYKFTDIVDVARFSNCHTCSTFVYTIPCQLDVEFEPFVKPLGGTSYPLNTVKIITVDNELIKISSRIGRNWLDVKFKKDIDSMRPMFEMQLASYVSLKNNIYIEM